MNIHYRIIKVDPGAHGIVVRYFTDKVTELDLANSLNPDGSVIMNADGYPISTRTDITLSIYDTPAPNNEEIEKRIMLSAPVDWLKLQEDIKDPSINTKMTGARDMVGNSKSFTKDDLTSIREEMRIETQEQKLQKAQNTVTNLLDSLQLLSSEDADSVKEFIEVLEQLKKNVE